jgi:hypothetical protein
VRIDTRELRRRYEAMPDGELLAIDPAELTEAARTVYDEELSRRGLTPGEGAEDIDEFGGDAAPAAECDRGEGETDFDADTGPAPDWLETASCACAFACSGGSYAARAAAARAVLRSAGIPCHVVMGQDDLGGTEAPQNSLRVMVPHGLYLHASSILDRDLFNEEHEAEWRTHLQALSDEDLRGLSPDLFCAGLLDRIDRIQRAFEDEMDRRRLQQRRRR